MNTKDYFDIESLIIVVCSMGRFYGNIIIKIIEICLWQKKHGKVRHDLVARSYVLIINMLYATYKYIRRIFTFASIFFHGFACPQPVVLSGNTRIPPTPTPITI